MVNLSIMIDDENSVQANAHSSIRHCIGVSVAKTCIEGVELIRKKISNVFQGCNLEHLRLPMNHLSLEGAHETVGAEDDWAIGHHKILILSDTFDVLSCVICLTYGP